MNCMGKAYQILLIMSWVGLSVIVWGLLFYWSMVLLLSMVEGYGNMLMTRSS